MAEETVSFTASVKAEGPTQGVRGKIPTSLINYLGAESGDVIEFQATKHGRTTMIIGSKVHKGASAERLKAAKPNSPKAEKAQPKAKTVAKTVKQVAKPAVKKPVTVAKKTVAAPKVAKAPVKTAAKPVVKRTAQPAYEVPRKIKKLPAKAK